MHGGVGLCSQHLMRILSRIILHNHYAVAPVAIVMLCGNVCHLWWIVGTTFWAKQLQDLYSTPEQLHSICSTYVASVTSLYLLLLSESLAMPRVLDFKASDPATIQWRVWCSVTISDRCDVQTPGPRAFLQSSVSISTRSLNLKDWISDSETRGFFTCILIISTGKSLPWWCPNLSGGSVQTLKPW